MVQSMEAFSSFDYLAVCLFPQRSAVSRWLEIYVSKFIKVDCDRKNVQPADEPTDGSSPILINLFGFLQML